MTKPMIHLFIGVSFLARVVPEMGNDPCGFRRLRALFDESGRDSCHKFDMETDC